MDLALFITLIIMQTVNKERGKHGRFMCSSKSTNKNMNRVKMYRSLYWKPAF